MITDKDHDATEANNLKSKKSGAEAPDFHWNRKRFPRLERNRFPAAGFGILRTAFDASIYGREPGSNGLRERYHPVIFPDAFSAQWVRLVPSISCTMTAEFMFT